MTYYIQIEATTNNVLGYSSNKMNDTDIEMEEEKLEERFLMCPIFYKFNASIKEFEFSEDLLNEYKEKKNNIKKPEDVLLKQLADLKIDAMKKDTIIGNLIKQMAAAKVENMQMKGSTVNE